MKGKLACLGSSPPSWGIGVDGHRKLQGVGGRQAWALGRRGTDGAGAGGMSVRRLGRRLPGRGEERGPSRWGTAGTKGSGEQGHTEPGNVHFSTVQPGEHQGCWEESAEAGAA